MKFQPIDTAPKTGLIILGFKDTGEGGWPCCQAYWSPEWRDWVVANPFYPTYEVLRQMTDYRPTHWTNMPEITDHAGGDR